MYFDISKKSKYAILALIELALRGENLPLNARKLALQNNLPVRFMEVILNELKQGGFVQSIRGKAGGYILGRSAEEITLGQLLDFLETKQPEPVLTPEFSPAGQYAVNSLMQQANSVINEIFEGCSLAKIVLREMEYRSAFEANFVI